MSSPPLSSWSAVVPIRDFATGKSRLRGALADREVTGLARWLAQRALAALDACREVSRVWVVSDVNLDAGALGRKAIPILQRPGGGLNGAVSDGRRAAVAAAPNAPVLVMHADLPRVTALALRGVLRGGGVHDSFVPDRSGRGTTLLALSPGSEREHSFGIDSAARHAALGYSRLSFPVWSPLRNDLDTIDDLFAVAPLSEERHTLRVS